MSSSLSKAQQLSFERRATSSVHGFEIVHGSQTFVQGLKDELIRFRGREIGIVALRQLDLEQPQRFLPVVGEDVEDRVAETLALGEGQVEGESHGLAGLESVVGVRNEVAGAVPPDTPQNQFLPAHVAEDE